MAASQAIEAIAKNVPQWNPEQSKVKSMYFIFSTVYASWTKKELVYDIDFFLKIHYSETAWIIGMNQGLVDSQKAEVFFVIFHIFLTILIIVGCHCQVRCMKIPNVWKKV